MQQWAAALLAFVRHQSSAVLVAEQPRHGQSGRTEWRARGGKLATTAAFLDKRHRREAAGLMKVVVDVVGVEGSIPGAVARLAAQALLDRRHEREEVTRVALVEWAPPLGQHDLSAIG